MLESPEERLTFMRARGRFHGLVAEFMEHYVGSRTKEVKENHPQEWWWLWDLTDPQRAVLLAEIIQILVPYHVTENSQEAYDQTLAATNSLLQVFSVTQMTSSLRKPSVLGA